MLVILFMVQSIYTYDMYNMCNMYNMYVHLYIPLNVGDFVHGAVSGEGNSEVVSEGEDLAALVSEVVDELAIFSVFASQHLLQLEHWRVNCLCPVPLER